MNLNQNFESVVEQAAIKWFKDIGYEYLHGNEIPVEDRKDYREVILKNRLYKALKIGAGIPIPFRG